MVHAFVTRAERVFVKYVALQPNLCFQTRTDGKLTAQCTAVNEHFQLDTFEIEVNPKKLAA